MWSEAMNWPCNQKKFRFAPCLVRCVNATCLAIGRSSHSSKWEVLAHSWPSQLVSPPEHSVRINRFYTATTTSPWVHLHIHGDYSCTYLCAHIENTCHHRQEYMQIAPWIYASVHTSSYTHRQVSQPHNTLQRNCLPMQIHTHMHKFPDTMCIYTYPICNALLRAPVAPGRDTGPCWCWLSRS